MQQLSLKTSHKPATEYYKALGQFKSLRVSQEAAVRSAFQNLLESCCQQFNWKLVHERPITRAARHAARADGALVDEFRLTHGLWALPALGLAES